MPRVTHFKDKRSEQPLNNVNLHTCSVALAEIVDLELEVVNASNSHLMGDRPKPRF